MSPVQKQPEKHVTLPQKKKKDWGKGVHGRQIYNPTGHWIEFYSYSKFWELL